MLLPRPDVHFFPFSEGAALFRQTTRQLTVLNQNAAFIWCLLNEFANPEGVASALQERFPISKDKATEDVREAVTFFQANNLLHEGSASEEIEEFQEDIIFPQTFQAIRNFPVASPVYQKVFQVPGLLLEICCQDKKIGAMVDEAMAYLGTDSGLPVEACLSIVPAEKETDCWDILSQSSLLFEDVKKQSVLPHILQLAFDLSCKALARYFLFHAAVVCNNSKAVLFPAHVGNGKTTLAAMLSKKEFKFFSDELAVIDVENLQVLPFAMPMSIKPGSVPILATEYPELETLTEHFRPDGKVVHYLQPPNESLPKVGDAADVAAFVFPQYGEGVGNQLVSLAKKDALQRLVKTCSSDRPLRPQDIKAMLAMVEQSECLALHFENTQEALRLVKEQGII